MLVNVTAMYSFFVYFGLSGIEVSVLLGCDDMSLGSSQWCASTSLEK